MDFDSLRIFLAVVDTGGITPAARRLHRVQSNVTTRIRQLEETLGVPLFLRERNRLSLSAAGLRLEPYARRMLALADEAHAATTGRLPATRLRLGSMESTAAVRLPPVLARFHAAHPHIRLELKTAATAGLLEAVRTGHCDAALVAGPVDDDRLLATPVYRERIVAITALGHPPIHDGAALARTTLLTFEPGCAYRGRLETWFALHGVKPESTVELSSYHAMISCAASGMGIALVPESLLDSLPQIRDTVRHHTLPESLAHSDTLFIRRKDTSSPAAEAFLDALLASGRTEPPLALAPQSQAAFDDE